MRYTVCLNTQISARDKAIDVYIEIYVAKLAEGYITVKLF